MHGENTEKLEGKKWIIGESPIHGRGVFAKKNLKKDEIVFILKGKIRTQSVLTKEDIYRFPNWIGIEHLLYIDPKPPAVYINHSCEPNLGTTGKRQFRALRGIKKGEELTFDYAISEETPWTMYCKCGVKHCRKIIGPIFTLPEAIFKKYLPYIPKYFQSIYKKNKKYS